MIEFFMGHLSLRYRVRETYVEKRATGVSGEGGRGRRRLGESLMAPLIYSGRELMYGPLLDVVGTFHSAASRRDKR